eukprot:CAMPEP_0179292714 /NCGR_PEP_ID=MMETSP0797-20121207/42997_1 /TAXON_ID=47934 /ORGANISM="Dinophysis acuminata, Strain DAEP01" /LENGTH=238 /DNA_ID=CAMNT_0021001833 /DNA_START=26 /DNA_END=739 /DNA_ORIENTATION=+
MSRPGRMRAPSPAGSALPATAQAAGPVTRGHPTAKSAPPPVLGALVGQRPAVPPLVPQGAQSVMLLLDEAGVVPCPACLRGPTVLVEAVLCHEHALPPVVDGEALLLLRGHPQPPLSRGADRAAADAAAPLAALAPARLACPRAEKQLAVFPGVGRWQGPRPSGRGSGGGTAAGGGGGAAAVRCTAARLRRGSRGGLGGERRCQRPLLSEELLRFAQRVVPQVPRRVPPVRGQTNSHG